MVHFTDGKPHFANQLYIDDHRPRNLCFLSHAHSDHLSDHRHAICTDPTAELAKLRVEVGQYTQLNYLANYEISKNLQITLFPAGHILGSAMIYVQTADETVLYTGDFKLGQSLTAESAQLQPADTLIMESTYGLSEFVFPPRASVIPRFLELVEEAFRSGRQPIVLGYSLGKSQEIMRILANAGHRMTVHGAVARINQVYERFNVSLGNWASYDPAHFHGPNAQDLRERGVLIAPPQVARTAFVSRFANPCTITMTGWAILRNAQYRYGVEHVLPFSDHCDFNELIETVERVNPKRVYTLHGYREFAQTLRDRGWDARLAKPDPQMSLFDGLADH